MSDAYCLRCGSLNHQTFDCTKPPGMIFTPPPASPAAAGYYSAGYREARRELQERRKAQADARAKRSGNFVQEGGRLIYRP